MNQSPREVIRHLAKAGLTGATSAGQAADGSDQTTPNVSGGSSARSLESLQRLVAGVCQATADAACEVSAHQSRVQTLADELGTVGLADPAIVAVVVQKLLQANAELQQRLAHTERAIESHQRELKATVRAAQTDALTGLVNRRVLEARLQRALREHEQGGGPATLLMLDLDHFKSLNDTYGHMAGDAALRQVAQVLQRHAGAGQLAARYGGEEFAVLFSRPLAEAAPQAEAIRQAIGQSAFSFNGTPIPLTASGGLAELVAGDSPTAWIERADKALYAAKRSGRNCTFQISAEGVVERVRGAAVQAPQEEQAEESGERGLKAAAAELAPDAFADTTFPEQIARRIAEWRRGGATLTVVLLRVVAHADGQQLAAPTPAQMRAICAVAQRQIRAMDVLTRWQSDGLALLLPGMGGREARGLMARLVPALPEALAGEDGRPMPVGLRAGIAEGLEGNDARRVLERAWLAVQASLHDPEGRIFLHDGVRARPLPNLTLRASSR
jgi:diguanylate cyclase